jgi:N-methylhydantoinase A
MAAKEKRYRIGMDSGGTFTDMVVLDSVDQKWALHKTLSEHTDPKSVLLSALGKAADGFDVPVDQLVEETEIFIIGTTVATNALLQNRGAKVGVLATKGHEDSLEIREGHKEDGHRYDWEYPPAEMLAPRSRRAPITERVLYDGSVSTPLEIDDVEEAAKRFAEEEVEAVAVSFLWSFQNTDHESRAKEILAKHLPDAHLSVSHELLPMINEYNRISTVTVNAYVAPVVARFVDGMEAALKEVGFTGPVRYFQANGGMSSAEYLVPRAIYALNSGPAAAPTAGKYYAGHYGKDVITVDAGGTSFDVGLVRGEEIDVKLTSDVARYRIGIPMVNIETLGAGGGSIAWIDPRGLLSVGPRSAESRPGPACYGFGGDEPTVTDALVVLGWFNQGALLGGEMEIDSEAAVDAVRTKIAEPLGLSVEEAAEGIIRVATSNMVGGVRRVSIERGYDPREAVLVACGGSGPAFACRVADELEMDTVVVPRVASGFCAFGAAVSEVKHDFVSTYTVEFSDLDLDRLNEVFETLETRGRNELSAEGVDNVVVKRSAEVRYVDQIHNCLVSIPSDSKLTQGDIDSLRKGFDEKHEELYTYSESWNEALLVNIHTSVIGVSGESVTGERSTYRPYGSEQNGNGNVATGSRDIYLESAGDRVASTIYPAAAVAASGEIQGPAVIEEKTTTIALLEGWNAKLNDLGFYELNRTNGAAKV